MTAVTLSTLAYRSLIIQEQTPAEHRGRGTAAVGRGTPHVDRVLKVSTQHAAPSPGRLARPDSETEPKELDAKEHQARGLLNLIALLARCLESGSGNPGERREWRSEVDGANERLEALYRSGLPRAFLSGPPVRSINKDCEQAAALPGDDACP